MAQVISRSAMGALDKLGQGGQGVVYRAPSVRTTFAKSMVFKEYKSGTLASLNVAALKAMPEFLESLPYRDGAKLISLASWPCAVVEDGGGVTGFLMPSIPDEFSTEFWTARGPSRVEAQFQHLLNEPQVLAARFRSGVISDRQRYELLQQAASALAFLHERGVCVGDISPKNLLFALSPSPAVYFVDCDAMRVRGVSLTHQVETPGWEVPAGQEKATIYSDRYKLGLLALRLLVGSQDGRDPARLPPATPPALRQVIADTLSQAPQQRPSLDQWDRALAQAIAVTPHVPPLPPPPITTPRPTVRVIPAPPPIVTPRPTAAAMPPSRPGLPPLPSQTPVSAVPQAAPSNRNAWLLVAGGLLLSVVLPLIITNLNISATTSSPTTRATSDYPPSISTSTKVTTVTETSTITRTPATTALPSETSVPQPYWSGSWIRNYWEDPGDCTGGKDYWVVQPGDDSGMYALKTGCFPANWANAITTRCQSLSLPDGICAIWDPGQIMSVYRKHGDIQVVALTNACLERAGLTEFHQGPLHTDCMVSPSS